jgi:hypothetical protein
MTSCERIIIRCLRAILWVLFGKAGLYNMQGYRDLQKDIDELLKEEER